MIRGRRRAWTVAVLFAATFAVSQGVRPAAAPEIVALDTMPLAIAGLTAKSAPPLDPDTSRILAADQYVHRYYSAPGAPFIEMDLAYYAQPRVGATAHSPLNCLPGNGWTMTEPVMREVRSGSQQWMVNELTVGRGDSRWAMSYWFQNSQRIDAGEFAARWHVFTDALYGRPADIAMVRVMSPVDGGDAAARTAVAAFASELIPRVHRLLATGR